MEMMEEVMQVASPVTDVNSNLPSGEQINPGSGSSTQGRSRADFCLWDE